MEHDRVARLDVALGDVLLLQRGLDIGCGDLLACVHHPAFEPDHVDQMRAREDRLELLNSELLETIGVADLRSSEAIVESHLALVAGIAHLDTNMTETVELRAGLADLGSEKLVVIDHPVVAER